MCLILCHSDKMKNSWVVPLNFKLSDPQYIEKNRDMYSKFLSDREEMVLISHVEKGVQDDGCEQPFTQ